MRLLPSFLEQKSGEASVGCAVSFNAHKHLHVLIDSAERTLKGCWFSNPGMATVSSGPNGGAFYGVEIHGTMILFFPPTKTSSKCL